MRKIFLDLFDLVIRIGRIRFYEFGKLSIEWAMALPTVCSWAATLFAFVCEHYSYAGERSILDFIVGTHGAYPNDIHHTSALRLPFSPFYFLFFIY